ncbi:hypothetical protein WJX84_000632, partial [Apatococcus fuscideae]
YTNIYVGKPSVEEDYVVQDITPQQCRLRDMTYAAPITVDIEYTKGKDIIVRKGKNGVGAFTIGRMPIMLRCDRCVLKNKNEEQLAALGECPLDPGGYFVVKGTEKVILIQEQLSKNRIIIDKDSNDQYMASVTSSTTERKSKTNLVMKKGRLSLRHNAFQDDINIVVVMKAMGIESDQELVQLVGQDPAYASLLAPTLEECQSLQLYTQQNALEWLGGKVKSSRQGFERRTRSRADEARDILANVIVCHVEVDRYNFTQKVVYLQCGPPQAGREVPREGESRGPV